MKKTNIVPPHCPTCGSMKRGQKEGSRVIPFNSIQTISGVKCNAVRLSYVTCSNCGQRYIVREPIEKN